MKDHEKIEWLANQCDYLEKVLKCTLFMLGKEVKIGSDILKRVMEFDIILSKHAKKDILKLRLEKKYAE